MRGTVLVIDDDPGVRRCLGEFLEAEGYEVMSAPNGRAALAVLEDELPDLMLIDVAMPVMSGWKLVEALSHYPDLARIPRILMGEPQFLDALPDDHRVLEKPVDLEWVASAVAAVLRPLAARAAAA
jgi:CheY-like chemotaxis protein